MSRLPRIIGLLLALGALPAFTPLVPAAPGYAWEALPAEAIRQHYRALLRLTLADGERVEGMLVDVIGQRLRLQLAGKDGGGLREIALPGVRRIEVLQARSAGR